MKDVLLALGGLVVLATCYGLERLLWPKQPRRELPPDDSNVLDLRPRLRSGGGRLP